MSKPAALIVGAGPGISLAFAEALVGAGYQIGLAARNIEKLRPLAESVGAVPFTADASSADSIVQLFLAVDQALGAPEVVLFNPSARIRGELLSLDIDARERLAIAGLPVPSVSSRGSFQRSDESSGHFHDPAEDPLP